MGCSGKDPKYKALVDVYNYLKDNKFKYKNSREIAQVVNISRATVDFILKVLLMLDIKVIRTTGQAGAVRKHSFDLVKR